MCGIAWLSADKFTDILMHCDYIFLSCMCVDMFTGRLISFQEIFINYLSSSSLLDGHGYQDLPTLHLYFILVEFLQLTVPPLDGCLGLLSPQVRIVVSACPLFQLQLFIMSHRS